MAEYKFTVDDFSLTSTWQMQGRGTAGYILVSLNGSRNTKTFDLSSMTLPDGEKVTKVILTATLTKSGTVDDSSTSTANDLRFNGSRKLDSSTVVVGSGYEVSFYFCASGNIEPSYSSGSLVTLSCTQNYSNVTLTVTTGTGNVFNGKVSSLNEGDKIIIGENSVNASYTLVHHEYNPGKALIFRDSSYGKSAYRSSASYNGYNGSKLDKYLTETFFTALPETTTQFLQTIDYPIKEAAYNSASAITINRTAATISAIETGLGGTTGYGSVLNYTDTIGIGTYYWTREPVSGMDGYAKCINSSNALANQNITSSYGVRPTLGVLEEQLVRYSEADGGYLFCNKCAAPDTLYINGLEADVSGLNREVNLTLSWTAGTAGYNAPISGYAVWYSTTADGTYELYGTTTDTSMTIIGPTKSSQTYYFKVQTLGPEDADYCNSGLSFTYRAAATKLGNVSYYDGTRWLLAAVKYYNGSQWVDVKRAKSYDGNTWK